MNFEGEGKLLKIYIGEQDRFDGKLLYEAIIKKAREEGLAGATVLRGIEGLGAHGNLHKTKILRLAEDLPIVIEIANTTERIESFLPTLTKMVSKGLIITQNIRIVSYDND